MGYDFASLERTDRELTEHAWRLVDYWHDQAMEAQRELERERIITARLVEELHKLRGVG